MESENETQTDQGFRMSGYDHEDYDDHGHGPACYKQMREQAMRGTGKAQELRAQNECNHRRAIESLKEAE